MTDTIKQEKAEKQLSLWRKICHLPIVIEFTSAIGEAQTRKIKLYPEVKSSLNYRIHIHLTPEMAEFFMNSLQRQLEDHNPSPGLAFDYSIFDDAND